MSLPILSLPQHTFVLPSTGKPIVVRPFVVAEEKILLMAKETGDMVAMLAAIRQIITNCVTDGTPVDRMSGFDLEYLFIKLRAVSVNNIVELVFRDTEDSQAYTFDVDLNSIEITTDPTHKNIVDIGNGLKLKLKYPPTVVDPEIINSKSETEALFKVIRKTFDQVYSDEQIWSFDETTDLEVASFMNSLSIPAFDAIQLFLATMPKIQHVITYTNKMGHERKITLSKLSDFFTFA